MKGYNEEDKSTFNFQTSKVFNTVQNPGSITSLLWVTCYARKVNVASFELFTPSVNPDQPGETQGSDHPDMAIVELQKEAGTQGDVLREDLSGIWAN